MSLSSIGILRAHELDSTLSILSHSDSGQSSVDSLEESRDQPDVANDVITGETTLNDSLEKIKHHGDHNGNTMEEKPEKSADSLEDTNDGKGKSNKKDDTKIPMDNDKINGTSSCRRLSEKENGTSKTRVHVDTPMIKHKVPKSKTFDDSVSIFNNKSAKTRFQNDEHKGPSGSGNHVFMTSQECMVVPGCSKLPRETIASRLRFEKQHSVGGNSSVNLVPGPGEGFHKNCAVNDGYLTPLQRKEILIRDLKRQVREMNTTCEAKDREIGMYKQHVDEKTSLLVQNKDEEITRLRAELKELKQNYDDISTFCEESIATASVLERKTTELKHAMDDREKQHQKIYLEMYRKGQDSAKFEREEELERLAGAGGCKVTISELVRKLAWTELELAKWQTIKRHESYHDATRPETESDATLRFLKDSFFHYITDEKDSDHHLRAMIKIFKYTEPQMQRIKESRLIAELEKRNKKKTKR